MSTFKDVKQMKFMSFKNAIGSLCRVCVERCKTNEVNVIQDCDWLSLQSLNELFGWKSPIWTSLFQNIWSESSASLNVENMRTLICTGDWRLWYEISLVVHWSETSCQDLSVVCIVFFILSFPMSWICRVELNWVMINSCW